MQQGEGPGGQPQPNGRRSRDPLGRATRNDGGMDTRGVQVPEESDLGRARDVLEELLAACRRPQPAHRSSSTITSGCSTGSETVRRDRSAVAQPGRAATRRTDRHAGPALYRHAQRRGGTARACATPRPRSAPTIWSTRTAPWSRWCPRSARAWHAGRAGGRGGATLNDVSLGIELVNPGHEWGYRPFPEAQMAALVELAAALCGRWRDPARSGRGAQRRGAKPQGRSGRAVRLGASSHAPGCAMRRRPSAPSTPDDRAAEAATGPVRLCQSRRGRPWRGSVRAFQRRWRPAALRRGPRSRDHGPRRSRSRALRVGRAGWLPSTRCRRPDGRSRREAGEESPGSTEIRCRVTPGGGDPRESATESRPPAGSGFGRAAGKGERVR